MVFEITLRIMFCVLRDNMNKKNIILGGILIFLIILAWLYSGPFKNWQKNSNKTENFLAALKVEDVSRIEVTNSSQTTTLEKQGERLKISNTKDFYAQDELVKNLTKALEDSAKAKMEIVSRNKDKKTDFQTDETSGSRIKLFQGEKMLADFVVGKMTNDYSGSYVSQPESDRTFSINVNLSGIFNRTDWRDNKIFASSKDQINKVRFQYPTREFTIEKNKDNKWAGSLPYKFTVREEKIDKILDIMSNLTAAQIPEQNFSGTDLEKSAIIIQASGEGIDNTLMIGKDNGKQMYYAKRGNSDNIYLITKEQRDELNKQIGELK